MAKRKKLKAKPKEIQELDGYSIDQVVYCKRYPDNKLSYGRIDSFHPNTEGGPAFTIIDYITGTFRVALICNIIDEPTRKQISDCQSSIGQRRLRAKKKN